MAKVKKISINAFEKAIKENVVPNVTVEEWCGLEIAITNTISLQDMMNIVSEVAENCFLEDGRFIPEVMQPLLDCGVVERYTNISLPANLEARYDLVMRSGILDFIMPRINSNQYNDIVVAVRDKIDYMCDTRTAEFDRLMDQMADAVNSLQDSTTKLFGNISEEDIRHVIDAFGDNKAIEERVVAEYIKQKNDNLHIVRSE